MNGPQSSPDTVDTTRVYKDLEQLLCDLEEYFDSRADADCDQDGFIPNEAMKFLTQIREILPQTGLLVAGVAQTMPRHTALELLARADKYLNTGSNEYASEILRDMTEFVRKSIIRKELRNADLPKHPMTPHSPDDPSLSSTLCGEK